MALDLDKLADTGEVQYSTPEAHSAKEAGSFSETYQPIFDKIGQRLGVNPNIIKAQFALETGNGKHIIGGTNNLGNIKDFSGAGTSATDNATGSQDKYKQFQSSDDFANHYASLIERKYPKAVGTGNDVDAFTSGLHGYAEDKDYGKKIANIYHNSRSQDDNAALPSIDEITPQQQVEQLISDKLEARNARNFNDFHGDNYVTDNIGDAKRQAEKDRLNEERGIVGDSIKSVGSGAVAGVQSLADLADAITGRDAFASISKSLGKTANDIQQSMSPRMQESANKDFFGKNQDAWTDPHAYLFNIMNAGGSMLAMAPIGGIGGSVLKGALGLAKIEPMVALATSAAEKSVAAQIAAGATKAAALDAGKAAGEQAFKDQLTKSGFGHLNKTLEASMKSLGHANQAGFMGASSLMTAGDAANSAMQTFDQLTLAQLMQAPDYVNALNTYNAAGHPPDEAAALAHEDVRRAAGRYGAAVGAILALPADMVIGHLTAKLLSKEGLGQTTRLKNVATAALESIPSEFYEEGATQGGANIGVKNTANPSQDVMENVADSAFKGMLGAGSMLAGHAIKTPVQATPPTPQPNSPLSNAAAAGTPTPPPAAPSMGFTDPKNIAMHQDITNFLNDRESLTSLRQAGQSIPEESLYVWRNVINNPELPLATRSRALEKAHAMLMNLGQFSQVATDNNPSQVATVNNSTIAEQPAALASDNTLEGDYIDEGKTLPRTTLPRTAIADNAITSENVNSPTAAPVLDSVSPIETADTPPVANAPVQEPDAFTQHEPASVVNMDATKKRHDTIRSMVAQGFQTVTKNDAGENILQHPTTGHTFPLTSPADTIVARHAIRKAITAKAHEAATSPNNDTALPTSAQIEANNYKKGHVNLHGLDIAIENPEGSIRAGTDRTGKAWESTLASHYGYIKKTTGADGDAVDVFIGSNPASDKAFIVDQINPTTGKFDEHKVMLGFNSQAEATQGYHDNYDKDWQGHGAIKELTIPEFKEWLKSDTTAPVRYQEPENTTKTAEIPEKTAVLNTAPDANVSTELNKQAAREWIRPEIEGLIRHKKDASQIGKRDQMDKLVDISKRYMSGDDVKPARIKALGMVFAGEPDIKATVDRIYDGIKSTPKVVVQPETRVAETAIPAIETPTIIDTPEVKEQKVSRDVQRRLFNELSNNAELLTQVANGEDAFLKAAEPLLAAQLEVMKAEGNTGNLTVDNMPSEFWGAVYRKAKSITAAIAKENNQDPAIYQEQLAKSAAESDINLDDSDVLNDFKAGFDHALKGKSKSTLTTGMVAVKQKGYEAAWSWIRTDDGKAWFEGKRKAKLQDTGADLKRWFDKAKEVLNNLPDSDPVKVYAIVKKLTERAKVFSVAYGENPTIGTKAIADELRGKIRPFNDWVIAEGGLRRQYGTMSRSDEGAILNFLNAKSYVPKDTGNSDEWTPQERADFLISQATDWMTAVRDLADALSGAATVQDLVDKFTTYAYVQAENTGMQLSTVGEELAYNFFMRTGRPSQFIKGGYYTNYYLATENLERVNNRSKALTPPRLDRVTRIGLADYRQGKDVTPTDVKAKFGFADIGFGQYVSTKQDQDHLNYTYDSFMDLSTLLNIDPINIGFGGKLYFTIGALGHGKHAAHFASGQTHPNGSTVEVLNITNTQGDGTVAHEWFHALDYYLGQGKMGSNRSVRTLVAELKGKYDLDHLNQVPHRFIDGNWAYKLGKNTTKLEQATYAINHGSYGEKVQTTYYKNAIELGEKYWGNEFELLARAAEAWVLDSMATTKNNYLVNDWVADGHASKENGYRGTPYPTNEERVHFAKVFDSFVQALSFTDGVPTIDYDAFESKIPSTEKEFNEAKQNMLAQLPAMLAAHEATRRAKQLATLPNGNAEAVQAHIESQRREQARLQVIAEAELANAVKPDATVTEGALSEDELNAIFDDAENEIAEEQQEQTDVPNMGDAAIGETKDNGELTRKATSQLLADAAKLGLTGMDEALGGLAKIFGAGRIMSFPSGFDEEAYKKAKPHFEAALKASRDLGLTLQELFKRLIQLFGAGVRPYAIKFAQEQELGASLANKEVSDATTDETTTRADDINGDAESSTNNVSGTESGAEPSDGDTGQSRRSGIDLRNDVQSTENADTTEPDAGYNGTDTPIAASAEPSLPSSIEPSNGVSVRGRDYHAPAGSLTREGSWRDTASRNLDVIELVKKLETENRPATPQEQAILVKYTGWGASELRNNLFTTNYGSRTSRLLKPEDARPDWKDIVARAQALLTPEDIDAAMRSSQYAHYTPEKIVRSIWAGLDRMGFSGGRILEGGMGTGLFAIAAPEGMLQKSRYTGIEMDTLTASIAKQLLPEQVVMQADFVKQKLPNSFFDVAIGNPPFANISIKDDPDYKKYGFMLHDYFFAKSIDKVRDGGILAFVTSRGTMDKQGDKARKYLAERADLLGAIRLPQTAFKENAGTQVITDVLFLRKRANGEAETVNPWMNLASVETNNGNTTMVNEYFAAHPEMVLGTHTTQRGQYSDEAYNVLPFEGDIEEQFAKAVQNLPTGIYTQFKPNNELVAETIERDFNPKAQKEGSVYITDGGRLMRREEGSGVPLDAVMSLTDRESAWMKGYVGLRNALKQAQFDQLNEGDWETSLKALNKTYDAFVKEHGIISTFTVYDRTSTNDEGEVVSTEYRRYKNNKLLRADTEGTLVESLEHIAEDGSITKSPFLLERTIKKPERQAINGLNDALLVSLDEQGHINLDHIAELAKLKKEQVIEQLGDLLYQVPNGEWQMSDEYLSGDVREKLEEAEAAARIDPKFERNVKALLLAQPAPLLPAQITVVLGANWIPATEITIFANEVLDIYTTVTYNQNTNVWTVSGATGSGSRRHRNASSDWGTVDRSTHEILSNVLNNDTIKITKTMAVDGSNKTYTDQSGTAAVNNVANKMRQEFSTWVWRDTNRAEQLSALYNKKFNNIARREFNGNHLTLPNLSIRYKLYDHQKRAIWRIIQTGTTYLAHSVGAGKSLEMIVSAMEQKRLGLISKPMFAVPNHMLEQFASEFLDAYPTANIMVADEINFHTDNRRRFVSQAALNAPDAIIITHSAFGLIKTLPETNNVVVDELIEQLEYARDDEKDRIQRSKIEARIENIRRKFDSKQSEASKDQQITFEELGVDFLYIDEGHKFRKLDFVTNINSKGIDASGSQMALGLYIKARWLNSQRPNRSLVMASGTPVVNTMAELYTVMRYMSPETLEKAGLDHFDAWANMFGKIVAGFEMNASGQYEVVERFAKFVNVPELMKRVSMHMDILTSAQLGTLVKRPNIKGGMPDNVIVPLNPATLTYTRNVLAKRIESSRTWKPSKDQKGNPDPLINIITDGRLSAIDMRFVDRDAENDPTSKLNVMIDDIIRDYQANQKNEYIDNVTGKIDTIKGSTQIIFSAVGFGDQVAKNRGFDAKAWIAKRLKEEAKITDIAFISDFNTAAKKEGLFKDMRSGKRKLLFGSPNGMGTGVNVQKRLKNLYFLSPPWTPAEVEQAMGRIVRQGNQNEEIGARWYATKGTYDSPAWAALGRKAKFIEQAFTGDDSVRSMEDVSASSHYEMASALASGDERAIQLAGYKADIERLSQLKQAHANTQGTLRHDKASTEFNIKSNTARLDKFKAAKALLPDFIYGDGLNATIGGVLLSKRSDIGDALISAGDKAIQSYKGSDDGADVQIGLALGTHPIMLNIKIQLKHNGVDLERVKVAQMFVQVGEVQMPLDLDHRRTYSDSDASGLATRLNNALNGVGRKVSEIEGNLDSLANQLKQINSKIGAPFPEARELFDKVSESAQLEKDMLTDKVEIPSDEALLAMKEAKEAGTAPPTGVDAQYYFASNDTGVQAIKHGMPIGLPRLSNFNFFIFKDSRDKLYSVTHVESGKSLARGDNKLAVLTRINDILDTRGIDSVTDIINNAPKLTEQDKQAAVKALDEPLESRTNDVQFANEALQELATHDELFRYPVSNSNQLSTVMNEVYPEFTYVGDSTREDEKSESGADKRTTFKNTTSAPFYVYETNKEVWIDVSRFEEGGGGNAVYAAVGNYAHNAHKVFVGDPQGLSEAATVRRTRNMLSLALRFGTTSFMQAAPEQVRGNATAGIEPLAWGHNNFDNVLNLIHTFVTTTENQNPEIKGYKYDFGSTQFVDAAGARVGRERFLEGSKRSVSRGARTGEATLRASIFAKSLISSEGSERPAILEQLLRRSSALVNTGGLNAMFSQHSDVKANPKTPESIRSAFIKAFGGKAIVQLEANNLIQIVATAAELPTGLNISKTGIAVFAGNKAYFIADRMSADTAHQALLHEIGEHYGLERMLGIEAYDTLLAKVRELKDSDAVVQAAWDFVSKNYPTLSSDSKNFMHEVLAQIGQNADISTRSWWKQVLEAAKRFLVKLGFTGMVKVSDIQDMVLHSLKVAATLSNNELASNQSSLFDGAALASNADQTDTLAFKQWFGDSKVVDTDGKPLVVYHGTGSDFDTFKKTMPAHGMNKKPQNGFFFTDTFTAGSYAVMNEMYGKSNANIMPIYLKLSNPIIIDRKGREFLDSVSLQKWVRSQVDRYQNSMHDGLIIKNINDIGAYLETQYVVFSPNQIKSAIGNNGNFDSSSNNILESRGNFFDGISMDMLRADLTHRANDAFNTKKTFNNWWHKTFGTQSHKAKVDPEHFGKVYDMAQLFIRDFARYANTAADQAPNLLPKMESVMDAVRGLGTISRDNADAKAIAAPIFEGTLNDEVYDTDKLRSRFNLTDRQITLYKEFRAAVNQSLDDLAISEMGRLARTEAIPRAPEGVSLDEATAYYRQHYEGDLEKAKLALDDLKERQHQERGLLKDAAVDIDSEAHVDMLLNMHTRHATELAEANAAVDNFMELHKGIQEKADEINALKANGYAPLMRFGRYTVDVYIENKDGTVFKDASGEEQRQFFGMFESEAEANYMARMLQDEYPSSVVKQGILSQEEFNLFRGVTPETIELYAKLVGDSQSAAFQKYLKMAVNNRSAMKRLIKRLGVKGFSDDPTRVLASFITSNARAAASNDYFGDMLKQVSDIPKHKGDVKDEAIKLMEYIQNPQEEASKLRGLLFMNFLGGSIASALVNMTQPILMTYPYLHQFSPSAAKHLAWAMKVASKKLVGKDFKIDDEALTFALSRAADEGVTSPHEVYMLYGEASRTSALSGNRWLRNLTKVWGGFFAVAENFNRHATFIAAFKIAEENGLSNDAAYDFAKKAVDDTQGVYCVDRETEILTHEGWMRMENLVVGMPVYSVDDKGRLIDSVLENVHIFSGAHKVHHFTNSNGFSMVVTDNHDCMIQNYNSRDEKWQALRKVKAKDIKNSHHVLRVPQGDATGRVAVYTDDEVRLFSWVAAEGHLFAHRGTHVKRGVGLSQSLTHNPEYVAEIDALLERLGGHYNRKSAFKKKRGDTMIYWQLRKILWMKVHLALPAKQITPEFVSKLTTSQMEIFLQVFVQADGHIPEEGHAVIVQKSIQNLDMLHMMATLSGHGASVRHRSDQHDFGYLCLHKQTKRSHVKAMSVTTEIVDTVWCPETTSGNWIARRNGRTFVTGNSKANRPNWARGAVGATLFTFKQFSVAYIEFLKRLPAKERALALAILVLASGVQGLPIVSDDLDDLIDTLMQSLGLSWNTKEEKRDFVAKIFGKEGANYVMYGISNGLPIDLAGRLSAGNLLPMTAILKKSESDKTRDVGEFFGAVGGAATNYMTGFEKLQGGNYTGAAKAIAPKALSDAFKGYDMWVTGEAHDSKGRLTAKATPIDALVKAIGFNPSHIASSSRDRGMLIQDANLLKVTQSNIYERWSQGVAQKDADKLASAKAELARWNAKNPTQKIEIKLSTIQRRVKAMHQDANERFIKSSPKQLRAENTAILNQ